MSLKDDFLEALKSVKRDFLKDYEDPGMDSRTEQPKQADPQIQPPPPPFEDYAEYTAPMSASSVPDEDFFSPSNEHSTMRDQFQPDLHTPVEPGTPDVVEQYEDVMSAASDEDSAADAYSDMVGDVLQDDDDADEDEYEWQGSRFTMETFEDSESLGDERTVISKNTVIRGALQTEDSVRMFGQVLGDIDCRSNILVAGKVRGNTSAANAYVINAQVDGNLLCDDVINVTDDAWILGNVRAQQADIDGKIKGNIEIRHSISIGSNSSVIGNISTDELEIRRGAFVNGQIMMYSPSRDVIDKFDRFGK